MKKLKFLLLAVAFSSLAMTSAAKQGVVKAHAVNGQLMDALPGQVIVKYRPGRSAHAKSRIFKTFSTQTKKTLDLLEAEILTVPPGESIDSFIKKLQEDPDVKFAEPNGIVKAFFTVDDSSFSFQYALQANRLNMPAAWDITTGSSTVIIAVIDTGILPGNHSELANQFITSTGTTMGIDFFNDGFDDVGCTAKQNGPDQLPHVPPVDNNFDTCDVPTSTNNYHGTRVSSVIGARINNTFGIAGIAPGCKLMSVKALNSKGQGSFESIAAAIVYASTNGASVINMSLGSGYPSSLWQAALNDFAFARNVVVVAAAGNTPSPPCAINYPAAYPGVIAVGSVGSGDVHSSFSCIGPQLDIVAPGENIITVTSTTIDGISGTSLSSPMVAAVAGLIRSLRPAMSYTLVTQYLIAFADDLGASGFDNIYGFGRMDAYQTLLAVSTGAAIPSDLANPGQTFPYPNPFHPNLGSPVTIAVPASLGTQGLEINIVNIAGETVKTLTGTNSWDGKNSDGNYVASGLYFYFLKTAAGNKTGKLTVIK